MCEPAFFEVVDQKNPFMRQGVPVDRELAREQWKGVVDAFNRSGLPVAVLAPLVGCEDMVFTANPAFTGLDARGERRYVASNMRFASRRAEVAPQLEYLASIGYTQGAQLADGIAFEGGGDALWDTRGARIFLGAGPRTDAAAATVLQHTFGAEIIPLTLSTERYYHLDTALAVLDDDTAIVYPGAFDDASCATLLQHFPKAIQVDESEANRMACNAAKGGGNTVIIDSGATSTIAALQDRGYDVAAVPTSEFMKSGGSVYCLKQYVF